MARKRVLVSDVSGKEIPDGEGATVTVKCVDAMTAAASPT